MSERFFQLRQDYLSPDNIRGQAYTLWEADGYPPNGDEIIETPLGLLKRRDYHWLHAQTMLEHFADIDAEAVA